MLPAEYKDECKRLNIEVTKSGKRPRSNASEASESLQLVSKPRTSVHQPNLLPDRLQNQVGNDAIHLHYFRSLWGAAPTAAARYFPRSIGSGVYIQILPIQYYLSSSMPYIRAILILTSLIPPNERRKRWQRSTQEYMKEFNDTVQKAKDEGKFVSSISAFYVRTQISLISDTCLKQNLLHFGEFCQIFRTLKESKTESDGRIATYEYMMQLQLEDLLSVLRQQLGPSLSVHQGGQPVRDREMYNVTLKIAETLDEWSCLLLSDQELDDYHLEMDTASLCQKIKSLAISLQIYLDIYVYLVSALGKTEEQSETTKRIRDKMLAISTTLFRGIYLLPVRDYIRSVWKVAVRMEPQSGGIHPFDRPDVKPQGLLSRPAIRDTALVLTYYFARLLITVLQNNETQDRTALRKMTQYARAMAILCACLPSGEALAPPVAMLRARYLFYAGSILTNAVDSDGTLPLPFNANSSEFANP